MRDKTSLPWYDSYWLTSYIRARSHLAEHHPALLPEFLAALAPLRTAPDFRIRQIPQLFDADTRRQLLELVASTRPAEAKHHELHTFGRLVTHDAPLLSALQADLLPRVSEWAGEELEASYNFLSMYNNLGVCNPHMDAPAAKWTLDYCISQSAPWPILFSQVLPWPEQWHGDQENWVARIKHDPENVFSSYLLEENQALLFAGSSQWHYRERIAQRQRNNYCNLAFFHFIPKGLRPWCDPGNWPALLGVPELKELVYAEAALVADTRPFAWARTASRTSGSRS